MKTLEEAAKAWWADNLSLWAPGTARYIGNEFEKYLFPIIGHMDLSEIKAKDILAMAKMAEPVAPTVARRIVQRLIIIFDLSIIYGDCEHNPARPVQAALNRRKVKPFAFIDDRHLPQFYSVIKAKNPTPNPAILAFWIIQHTALRRSEAIKAQWDEIDFDAKLWTVPACRMKNSVPHLVPLTKPVIKLLRQCKAGNKTAWLFPGEPDRETGEYSHISLWAPLCIIRAAGYQKEMTVHGARKVFSTAAHESGLWSVDSIELQLSHTIPGVRGVYNKATLLDERKKLMAWHSARIGMLTKDVSTNIKGARIETLARPQLA
jgi:integrase